MAAGDQDEHCKSPPFRPNALVMSPFPRLLAALVLLPLSSLRAEISLEEGIQAHLGKLSADALPGMAVLVARDGKILYQGGFGFADLGQKKPVTAGTRFRIGSVSKQFTAAAILRLADEGKLALADPLEKYFAGFPEGVTLDHLLTHTSGIHSYTDKPEFLGRVAKPIAPEDLIAWFRGDPPDFEPGKGFHYNNSAYFLLGEIVALANALPPVAGFEPAAVTRQIAGKLLEAEIRKLPPLAEDPAVDKKRYPDFVGRYDYKNAVLTVSVEGGGLHAQLTGQPKLRIHPKSATEFEWREVEASVTFKKDDTGKVTGVTHRQNGATFDAAKIED